MARIDTKFIFSICILLISLIYLYAAKDLVLGTMKRPGVGFLPIIAGTVATIFSLIEIVKLCLSKNDSSEANIKWRQIGFFFLGIILYALALNYVGYEIATCALLFFLTKLFGAKSWVKPLIFSVLVSLISYYLFAELLMVQLP
jgi:putative tricarboxylic transport membrane protein